MEAARRMDEAGRARPASDRPDRLAWRNGRAASTALRQAFDSVANQARPSADANDPQGSPFETDSQSSADVAAAAAGRRCRAFGSRDVARRRIAAARTGAFEQLRTRLLEGALPRPEGGACARGWPPTRTDGTTRSRTWTGKTKRCGFAPRGLVAARREPARRPAGSLAGVAGAAPRGCCSSPRADAESADRLLHACVAQMTTRVAGTILLAADHGRWSHAEGAGALVPGRWRAKTPCAAPWRPMSPRSITHARAASAAAMHGAARVVAAVVALRTRRRAVALVRPRRAPLGRRHRGAGRRRSRGRRPRDRPARGRRTHAVRRGAAHL